MVPLDVSANRDSGWVPRWRVRPVRRSPHSWPPGLTLEASQVGSRPVLVVHGSLVCGTPAHSQCPRTKIGPWLLNLRTTVRVPVSPLKQMDHNRRPREWAPIHPATALAVGLSGLQLARSRGPPSTLLQGIGEPPLPSFSMVRGSTVLLRWGAHRPRVRLQPELRSDPAKYPSTWHLDANGAGRSTGSESLRSTLRSPLNPAGSVVARRDPHGSHGAETVAVRTSERRFPDRARRSRVSG